MSLFFRNNKNNNDSSFNEMKDNISNNIKENTKRVTGDFRKFSKFFIFIMILIILLSTAKSFVFIVREDEVAVVREFGKITKIIVDKDNIVAEEQHKLKPELKNVKIIYDKGLFFKIPFITKIRKETSKLLTYVSQSEEINTKDKIKYDISMFAQWEITHPALFQMTLKSVNNASSFLDEQIYPVVIQRINQLNSTAFLTDKEILYSTLDEGLKQLNEKVAENGIVVKDIEIYRTLLPSANIESTYRKMVAEREAIAQQMRSEGQELYQKTVAETDKEVAQIIAKSIEESEKIRGEADAEALEIYANGFSRDPEFYEFWKTLDSYEKTIDEDTVIFMDKNNKFLKYFSGE
ncbi:protease modulator HflC [Paramaledivibacter caminithermalis]|jgi:membrane protease subunit HflC|uniref:Protein HflC n=1 Tax=Paramaledivibacter caminithermalis (strain DSM 15212 / CIP 107654 / DViRD3) TaxID=1121301 RepID=A0A1M6NNM8_PARC5|nr:protease modulator HflC [Paramaledivibacter caminithermalis]SHJ97331.1 membrane protease subunit HflC [Paramaledivibacter caminithermalis DSM 15212]